MYVVIQVKQDILHPQFKNDLIVYMLIIKIT